MTQMWLSARTREKAKIKKIVKFIVVEELFS
jgi:hypothetical protein